MSLTQEQIKHIANLSRLDLNSTDLSKYSEDLNSIVDYIDKLNEIDNEKFIGIQINTEDILPLREDKIGPKISTREELLSCSPKKIVNNQIAINNIMSGA